MRRGAGGVPGGRSCALAVGLCLILTGAREAPGEEQRPSPRNNVYGELLGNTLVGVNYERLLTGHAGLRVGIGVAPLNEGGAVVAVVMPTVLVGSGRHQLEVGAGAVLVSNSADQSYAEPTAALAYRHRASGRLFFRAGVAVDLSDDRLWLTPGFGVGISF